MENRNNWLWITADFRIKIYQYIEVAEFIPIYIVHDFLRLNERDWLFSEPILFIFSGLYYPVVLSQNRIMKNNGKPFINSGKWNMNPITVVTDEVRRRRCSASARSDWSSG